jgi:hypothetical protein
MQKQTLYALVVGIVLFLGVVALIVALNLAHGHSPSHSPSSGSPNLTPAIGGTPASAPTPSSASSQTQFMLASQGSLCPDASCSGTKVLHAQINGTDLAWITGGPNPTLYMLDGFGPQPLLNNSVPLNIIGASTQPPITGWLIQGGCTWAQATSDPHPKAHYGAGNIFQSTADASFNSLMGGFVKSIILNTIQQVNSSPGATLMAIFLVSYGDVSGIWNSAPFQAMLSSLGGAVKIAPNYPIAVAILPTPAIVGSLNQTPVPTQLVLQSAIPNPPA